MEPVEDENSVQHPLILDPTNETQLYKESDNLGESGSSEEPFTAEAELHLLW